MNDTIKDQPMDDFIQGQRDCRDGKPHESGKPEAYDQGYNFQYQIEAMMGVAHAS